MRRWTANFVALLLSAGISLIPQHSSTGVALPAPGNQAAKAPPHSEDAGQSSTFD